MSCWNVRSFSWIVAILHVVIATLAALVFIGILCLPDSEKAESFDNYEREKEFLLFLHISFLLYFMAILACAITLIVGLKQSRYELIMPFIYVVYLGIVLNLIISGRIFFWGIRHKRTFGPLALDLFTNALIAGVQGILLIPVYMLYRQLRLTAIRPEQPGLSTNEPETKPYLVQGGDLNAGI